MVEISLHTPSTSTIDQEVVYLLFHSPFSLTRRTDLLELQSIIPAEQVDIVEEVPDEKPAVAGPGPKSKSKKREVIVLDSDEEEEGRDAELERLRREVAAYKKVKLEEKGTSSSAVKQEEGKGKDRVVIDISD